MSATMQQLWRELAEGGVVAGEMPMEEGRRDSPWFVRAMVGISGWIAALFLLGFLALALGQLIDGDGVAAVVVGAFFIVAAWLLLRLIVKNDFSLQFSLAFSLAGQALLVVGLFQLMQPERSLLWLVVASLQLLLIWLMPTSIHRFWSAWAAAVALTWALAIAGLSHLALAALAAAVALLWFHELRWPRHLSLIRPVGYGITLALLLIEAQHLSGESVLLLLGRGESPLLWLPPWFGRLSTSLVLLVVWRLVGRIQPAVATGGRRGLFLAALLVAAIAFKAPGIATGLMVILLGFAAGNRTLLGVGIAALFLYISSYYYQLELTLLMKSGVLALMGVVLLAARAWLLRSEGASRG